MVYLVSVGCSTIKAGIELPVASRHILKNFESNVNTFAAIDDSSFLPFTAIDDSSRLICTGF